MSRIQPASPHHGKATSAASAGAATKAKARLAFVATLDALGFHLKSLVRGNSPLGRTIRMTRKAMWPARICQVGDSAAPTACATPSTTPPISVPHMLPSPPMITASKARMSRIGPAAGSKIVRMANSTPAIAVKIMAMPSASA